MIDDLGEEACVKDNISIDDKYESTSITIESNEWTEELEEIVQFIKKGKTERLFGVVEDQTILLEPKEIDFVYAENRKVFAALSDRNIEIKMKLDRKSTRLNSSHVAISYAVFC